MNNDDEKRAGEIYEWWHAYKAAADELEAAIATASNQHADGVAGKPSSGLELLLKAHREKQEVLWKEFEALIGD